jgi:cobalt/nickel transport protein
MEELMKKRVSIWMLAAAIVGLTPSARAHFGMVIPSDTMVMAEDARAVNLILSFSHPFERVGMPLVKPKQMRVFVGGEPQDLLPTLKEAKVLEHPAWATQYAIKRPGVYKFVMEPQPYWEPAEDCFIIHYTQAVVTAFGDDEGWDSELGLPTEIVPLTKPFGLYAGNLFQGVIKLGGRPVPYAEVEVEFFNEAAATAKSAPTEYMITQTIKADGNGVFSYTVPGPGWWGFAALNTADYTIAHGGAEKAVELGAVIWVRFHPWP